jgi:hypothetical protein
MEAAELLGELGIAVQHVDIDTDLTLSARFGLMIPVLERADGNLLCFPFDAHAVLAFHCA